MKKLIAAVAGVILVAYLASPLAIGFIAQRQFPVIMEAASIGAPQWHADGFQRGYLHSSAESTLSIPVSGRQPLVIHLHHSIAQRLGTDLSIAEVTTTPVLRGDNKAQLEHLFGGKSPFTVHTVFYADGRYTSTVEAPAIAYQVLPGNPAIHVGFAGLSGAFSGNANPRTMKYRLASSGFEIQNDKTHVHVAANGLALSGDAQLPKRWLQLGGGVFSIDKVLVRPAGTAPAEMDSMRIAVKTQRETDGLGFRYHIRIASLSAPPTVKVTNLVFEMAGHHLDEKSVESFAERLTSVGRLHLQPAQAAPLYRSALQSTAAGFLAHSPQVQIQRLGFDLPDGPVRLTADATFDGAGFKRVDDPDNIKRLSVDASLKAPASAVHTLVVDLLRPKAAAYVKARKPDATPAQIADLTARMADQTIQNLLNSNLMSDQHGTYVSALALHGGALTVNGKPIPLPPLPRAAAH
ncbi:MAG: DUF945 family protein [Gammaproteobacteria bacterium]